VARRSETLTLPQPTQGAHSNPVQRAVFSGPMSPTVELTQVDEVSHSEQVEQRLVLAWLRPANSGDTLLPGVLLTSDAVLIRAPQEMLSKPSRGLDVVVESDDGTGVASSIVEIRLIQDQRLNSDSGYVAAVLRLGSPSGSKTRAKIDRTQYVTRLDESHDFWRTVEDLGLIPRDLGERTPPPAIESTPGSKRIIPITREIKAGWCEIFWWLC
jgi:hypothetical protein